MMEPWTNPGIYLLVLVTADGVLVVMVTVGTVTYQLLGMLEWLPGWFGD